jgi:hypothetical protein
MSEAEKLIENLSKEIDHRNGAQRRSLSKDEFLHHSFGAGKDGPSSVPLDADFNFDEL